MEKCEYSSTKSNTFAKENEKRKKKISHTYTHKRYLAFGYFLANLTSLVTTNAFGLKEEKLR